MRRFIILFIFFSVLSCSFLSSCSKDAEPMIRYETKYVFNFELSGTDTLDQKKAPLLSKLADTVKILTLQAQERVYGRQAPSNSLFKHVIVYVGSGVSQEAAEEDAHIQALPLCESMPKTAIVEFDLLIKELEKIRGEYEKEIISYSRKYKIDYSFSFKILSRGKDIVNLDLGTFKAAGTAEPEPEPHLNPILSRTRIRNPILILSPTLSLNQNHNRTRNQNQIPNHN